MDAICCGFVGVLRPRWLEGAGCYSAVDARSALEGAEWRPVFLENRKMASKIRWIPDAIHIVNDMSLRPKHGNESNDVDAVDAMRVILRGFLRPRSRREWAQNGGKEELWGRLPEQLFYKRDDGLCMAVLIVRQKKYIIYLTKGGSYAR